MIVCQVGIHWLIISWSGSKVKLLISTAIFSVPRSAASNRSAPKSTNKFLRVNRIRNGLWVIVQPALTFEWRVLIRAIAEYCSRMWIFGVSLNSLPISRRTFVVHPQSFVATAQHFNFVAQSFRVRRQSFAATGQQVRSRSNNVAVITQLFSASTKFFAIIERS